MPGTGDDRDVDRTIAFFPGDFDLANSPIVVVGALHDRDRHADVSEIFGDIPVAKLWVEPRVVPSVERVIDIAVPALELRLKVGGLVDGFDLRDRPDRNILDNEMRRDQRQPTDA